MAKMANWRRHTVEFKRQVVERMKTCENIAALARELKLERKLLFTWKYQFEGRPEPRHANLGTTPEERKDKQLREEITKLKSALAEKNARERFFQKCLAQDQGRTPAEHRDWRLGIYDANRPWTQEQGKLTVERMCQLAGVSRAGYYRQLEESEPDEAEMALRTALQDIVLAHHRRYGYRRVTAELRRRGMVVKTNITYQKTYIGIIDSEQLKPVRWIGSSRKDVRSFPSAVRLEIGHALYAAQKGETDLGRQTLKGFGGRGVLEIVSDHRGDAWRSVYTIRLEGAVYVLHAFQKKSKSGIATPKKELDLIRSRLADAQRDHRKAELT